MTLDNPTRLWLQHFLDENSKLIDSCDFKSVYDKIYGQSWVPVLTSVLLESDINPLIYLDSVPSRYALDTDIQSVTIPSSIKKIESSAFSKCEKLQFVKILPGVEVLEENCFYRCDSLVTIDLPETVTSIKERAFCVSGLQSIRFPRSLREIGTQAFSGCYNLKEVYIPKNIKTIENFAFWRCKNLTIYYEGSEEDWNNVCTPAWCYWSQTKVVFNYKM